MEIAGGRQISVIRKRQPFPCPGFAPLERQHRIRISHHSPVTEAGVGTSDRHADELDEASLSRCARPTCVAL